MYCAHRFRNNCVLFLKKNGGRNQGRGENTEDKQEHKPATKNPGTGRVA
jgi:hypothetical protein